VKEIIGGKVVEYLMKQIPQSNKIEVDISFYHPNDDETKKVYDEEGMREEFENKLKQIIKTK
jgi:myo-inositol catabolism protein IolC